MGYGAYLLDIEGTITPVEFVTRTLFPFSASEIEARATGISAQTYAADDLSQLWEEYLKETPAIQAASRWSKPSDIVGASHYLLELIKVDRKSTALKSIQGKIWESGYRQGQIKGEVYPDVLPAIERWRSHGAKVAIFSSGSILAQRLLLGHLPEGDMNGLFTANFDTTTGSKQDAMSYLKIANALELTMTQVLFLSDVQAEIDAAREIGMHAKLVDRSGFDLPAGSIASFSALE